MSIHASLRSLGGKTGTKRNVLKRFERLQQLLTKGQWTEDRSAFGLPKTKPERVKIRKAATTAATSETPAANETKEKDAGAAPKAPPAS